MIEEVEAALNANPVGGLSVLAVAFLIGLLIDIALPTLQRWAGHRGWRIFGIIIHALRGLPTIFGITIGVLAVIWMAGLPRELVTSFSTTTLLISFIAVAIAAVRVLTSLVRLAVNQHQPSVSLINLLIRFVGGLVILAMVMSILGMPIAPLLTLLAGSSLGLSLALREPLSNLFAGLQVVVANRVRPGVYVRLASGQEGYVHDVRWSDTTIRQLDNATIIVPNTTLTNALLIDYAPAEHELGMSIPIGFHYHSNLQKVEQVTLEVASAVMHEVQGTVKGFKPFLRFSEFGDYAIKASVVMRVQTYVDQYPVRHAFIQRLHERFAQEGIVIPFPAVVVSYEDAAQAPADPEVDQARAEPEPRL